MLLLANRAGFSYDAVPGGPMIRTDRTISSAAIALCAFISWTTFSFAQATSAGTITGVGNFSHIVTSLEKSVEFYRDVIGLPVVTQPQPFSPNPAIMNMGNTPGAQSRIAVLKAPGSAIGVELIEYKDIDRKPANPRFQD